MCWCTGMKTILVPHEWGNHWVGISHVQHCRVSGPIQNEPDSMQSHVYLLGTIRGSETNQN